MADLTAALEPGERLECVLQALDGLAARNLRVIGVEGVDPSLLSGTRWARLPTILHGRNGRAADQPGEGVENPLTGPTMAAPSLVIDHPVRSGQSIYFEEGDITVIGSVASGAEVIAGGSIHVYGALRGRAIAGLKVDAARAARGDMMKVEDVLDILAIPLLGIVIESPDILTASNLGCPVPLHNAASPAARAYIDAARRLLGEQIAIKEQANGGAS